MNPTLIPISTLRETGSVRVVVVMEPQIEASVSLLGGWDWNGDCYDFGNPPRPNKHFCDDYSPLPSPGTIETFDGMRCEWVERDVQQIKQDRLDEDACEERWFCPNGPLCRGCYSTRDCDGGIIEPGYMNCSCGAHSYSEIWAAGVKRDYGIVTTPDTWLWTAIVRRKDDGDE